MMMNGIINVNLTLHCRNQPKSMEKLDTALNRYMSVQQACLNASFVKIKRNLIIFSNNHDNLVRKPYQILEI